MSNKGFHVLGEKKMAQHEKKKAGLQICTLLGIYASRNGSLKYHSVMHNIPAKHISHLHHGRSLKTHKVKFVSFSAKYIDQFLAYLKMLIMSAEQVWMTITNGEQGFERVWQCPLARI
jgi:hypothetical protein